MEVLRLLAAGANVNEKTADGWAPLHRAAQKGDANMDIMRALLDAPGIDINIRMGHPNSEVSHFLGWTPLFSAAFTAQADTVDLLLGERKIDVNIQNHDGDNALGYAYKNNQIGGRITAALKAHGAVCRCRNINCSIPRTYC